MPRKPKTTQPKTPDKIQGRDFFQTPNYAVDLLIPFIPKNIKWVWEPACGDGKIVQALYDSKDRPLVCFNSDIRESKIRTNNIVNFLTDEPPMLFDNGSGWAIITNPPFSLKREFYKRCLEYKVPFALLLPFDMSQWLVQAFHKDEIQALLPSKRIDYITPTGLSGATGHTSYYHSFWLTWGFNLPKQITVVELSLKEKKENI